MVGRAAEADVFLVLARLFESVDGVMIIYWRVCEYWERGWLVG